MNRNPTPQEMQAAIRAKCLDCMCGSRKEVDRCKSESCPLWAFREAPARDRPKPMRGQITIFDLVKREAREKGGEVGCDRLMQTL